MKLKVTKQNSRPMGIIVKEDNEGNQIIPEFEKSTGLGEYNINKATLEAMVKMLVEQNKRLQERQNDLESKLENRPSS